MTLSVDAGLIVKVDDFSHLGGWLKSSNDDFQQSPPDLAGMQLHVVGMEVC